MTCGHGQNFWQRLMTEGKQSSKVFRPLTHPGRESLCHMGRQHAHASTPKGFEPLRAEPNGFLVHLLSHSDTVSSAGDLHWLLRHSQSTFVHQPRRLMMSEAFRLSISNLAYSEPGSPFPDCREGLTDRLSSSVLLPGTEPRTGRKRGAAITTELIPAPINQVSERSVPLVLTSITVAASNSSVG